MGEVHDREEFDTDRGSGERIRVKSGNRDLTGIDFLWIDEDRRIQVEVVDESPNGIGVVIPADVSFEFGPQVFIDYRLERRSASIAHLTRCDNGSYRLGLKWN